jgi:cellulose synthase operon protein C
VIVRFATPEALAVALTTGLIRAALPGRTWRDGKAVLVEAAFPLAAGFAAEAIEVPDQARAIASLVEALPLLPAPVVRREVLFVDPPEGPLALAAELVRLGCDRIALAANAVRCHDAPEWVLSRPGLRAYAPVGPRLWVALGWRLPIALEVEGGVSLVEPDGRQLAFADGPWHDAAEVTTLVVPAAEALETPVPPRVAITLRLVATRAAAPPRLWVIPESRFAALDALVAGLDDTALAGLELAIARRADGARAVVRSRGHVEIDLGTAYAALPAGDTIHVPLGQTVAPRVWPSRLRQTLAPRGDEIVWIDPPFTVWRLPASAFVPLAAWIDFVVEEAAPALEPWVQRVTLELPPPEPPPPTPPAPALRLRATHRPPPAAPPPPASDRLADLERRILAALDAQAPAPWRELAEMHPDPREAALAFAQSVWHLADPRAEATAFLTARPALGSPALAIVSGAAPVELDDAHLDVRTAWLVARRLPFAAVARARDRWLDRLRDGLVLARDVAALFRRGGRAPSAETRDRAAALEELLGFLLRAPRPDNPLEAPWEATSAYLRLTVAHGFALLGEHERAAALAEVELGADPVHAAAQALYRARRDALLRADDSAPLAAPPPVLHEPLARYKLDRLRATSAFLGGVEWLDPTAAFRRGVGPDERDPARLAVLAAWEGRSADVAVHVGSLLATVAGADRRRAASIGRALAGVARGLRRAGVPIPDDLRAVATRATDGVDGLLLALPLAGVLGDATPVPLAEAALATVAGEDRLALAAGLGAHAAAAADPATGRRLAFALAALLPETTDVLSTNSHFALSAVRLAEAAVAAIAAGGALGSRQRTRLDEDERAVRQRLHADFEELRR